MLGKMGPEASPYRDSPLNPGSVLEVSGGLGEVHLIPGIPMSFLVCSSGSLTLRAPCTVQSCLCRLSPWKGRSLFRDRFIYPTGSLPQMQKCSQRPLPSWMNFPELANINTCDIPACFLCCQLGGKIIICILLYVSAN